MKHSDHVARWVGDLESTLDAAALLVDRGRDDFGLDPALPLAFEALCNRVGDLAKRWSPQTRTASSSRSGRKPLKSATSWCTTTTASMPTPSGTLWRKASPSCAERSQLLAFELESVELTAAQSLSACCAIADPQADDQTIAISKPVGPGGSDLHPYWRALADPAQAKAARPPRLLQSVRQCRTNRPSESSRSLSATRRIRR